MKHSIRRFIGVTSILASVLSVAAPPAWADTPDVSAALAADDKVLEAGETHDFAITFRNDEPEGILGIDLLGAGATVDALQIASPTSILDPHSFVVPATVGNFETFVDDGTITLFDGALAPQSTITVTFRATVKDLSTDRASRFFAQASQEGDSSAGPVTGDLSFIVKAS